MNTRRKECREPANFWQTLLSVSSLGCLVALMLSKSLGKWRRSSLKTSYWRNIESIISMITPYFPYLSLFYIGVTVGKHVSKHMYNKVSKEPKPESSELSNKIYTSTLGNKVVLRCYYRCCVGPKYLLLRLVTVYQWDMCVSLIQIINIRCPFFDCWKFLLRTGSRFQHTALVVCWKFIRIS